MSALGGIGGTHQPVSQLWGDHSMVTVTTLTGISIAEGQSHNTISALVSQSKPSQVKSNQSKLRQGKEHNGDNQLKMKHSVTPARQRSKPEAKAKASNDSDTDADANITTIFERPNPQMPSNKVFGVLAVLGFVGSWLSSALSPMLLYYSIKHQFHTGSIFLVITAVIAYIPPSIMWRNTKQDHPIFIFRWLDHFLTTYFTHWFQSVKVIAEDWHGDISDDRRQPYFYGLHPHGALCMGLAVLYSSMDYIFPFQEKVRFCFAPILFWSPIFRIFCHFVGYPGSAFKSDMITLMERNIERKNERAKRNDASQPRKHEFESLALLPGGFEEASIVKIPTLETVPSSKSDDAAAQTQIPPCTERLFLKRRAGFLRLALKFGYTVRPVFIFGESFLYHNVQGGWQTRLLMNQYSIPALFPWGWKYFPLLPRPNIDMLIVIGAPVDFTHIVPLNTEPDKDQLRQCHELYVSQLSKLYDNYKERAYGPELGKVIKLEVW